MIDITKLTEADKGRAVRYHREHCNKQDGVLSSWNDKYVFVRFKGPNGEACEQDDVSFICARCKGSGLEGRTDKTCDACDGLGRVDWVEELKRGTPLSELSGRPGHAGYDEFKRIASSWGYD